ncbi:MAG: hypothetical protein P8Z81_04880 [Deinococcales bacterium]
MNVLLMQRDHDFQADRPVPWNMDDLVADLGLDWLFAAMAKGDETIDAVCRHALSTGVADPDTVRYRQAALRDALANPEAVRALFELATVTVADERKHYFGLFRDHPDTILRRSVEVMQMFAERLRGLRALAEEHVAHFQSGAFDRLFLMLQTELDDAFLARIDAHLKDLRFRKGLLMSAGLGDGNRGTDYVLREHPEQTGGFFRRLLGKGQPSYSFTIPERDEGGFRALDELRDRGVNLVANALAQSNDHILGFFRALRDELAFYVGALNLHDALTSRGEPVCFPTPHPLADGRRRYRGLYDPSLALQVEHRTVGNDLDADGKDLIVITGANHGGKSTFLRALGSAQLMAGCGLFVAATEADLSIGSAVVTHFKREEDAALESGKLDEELKRMASVVENLTPGAVLLFNESFASTNEREGSEIARQVVDTLLEGGVHVHFVTHLYDFARTLHAVNAPNHLFLRAPRADDGSRSFHLLEGPPLPTSYGRDLYDEVFRAERPATDASNEGDGSKASAETQVGSPT